MQDLTTSGIAMPKRRQSSRERRSLEGRIGYAGRYRVRCLVLNLSKGGAKLGLKSLHANVPAEFFLRISGKNDGAAYWVRTIWRSGNMLGVAFTEPPVDSEPLLGLRHGHGAYRA